MTTTTDAAAEDERKERLGAFIHHPSVSVLIVALILASVVLVLLHFRLDHDDPRQLPIEVAQGVITSVFAVELSLKAYVAADRRRFLAQYWVDIVAVIPWASSLRVLRILRLLRVFRAALILSRRVRFLSNVLRSALGEYVVLGMILLTLLVVGSWVLYQSELHARQADPQAAPVDPASDLADPMNAAWATVFFLVANEPMIAVPRTTLGKAVVLVTMFGGLTTFAVFTGVVTAVMLNRLRRRMEIDDMDRFQLNEHIVICGWNNQVPLILEELQLAGGSSVPAVVIVAELEELPAEVTALGIGARVFFVRGDGTKPAVLALARIEHARRAIILADTTRPRSDQDRDARTVLCALMIERLNPRIETCAELLNRENEVHLRAAGIEEVVTTSEAGGHHLAMATLYPGLANVVSELLTAKVGKTLTKRPAEPPIVGMKFLPALEHLKREQSLLLVGIEVQGRDGARAPGYAMKINPAPDLVIGARDNLVVIIDGPR